MTSKSAIPVQEPREWLFLGVHETIYGDKFPILDGPEFDKDQNKFTLREVIEPAPVAEYDWLRDQLMKQVEVIGELQAVNKVLREALEKTNCECEQTIHADVYLQCRRCAALSQPKGKSDHQTPTEPKSS